MLAANATADGGFSVPLFYKGVTKYPARAGSGPFPAGKPAGRRGEPVPVEIETSRAI
jgi:hypothetical protein